MNATTDLRTQLVEIFHDLDCKIQVVKNAEKPHAKIQVAQELENHHIEKLMRIGTVTMKRSGHGIRIIVEF